MYSIKYKREAGRSQKQANLLVGGAPVEQGKSQQHGEENVAAITRHGHFPV
jgi:hypothetical protein